jgi:hypoxanthine phosphoribosyltransferase
MTIKDKQFKSYISELQIQTAVKNVSSLINADLENELPIFLVVLNGAFMFAADLLKEINIPCEISFVKVASYNGTDTSGAVAELIGLTESVSDRTVVIVEDIVDTGLTVDRIIGTLKQNNAKHIRVATAFMKPDSYKQDYLIDYVAIKIKNEFVVGYGLDYNGQGRNLKELYTLT